MPECHTVLTAKGGFYHLDKKRKRENLIKKGGFLIRVILLSKSYINQQGFIFAVSGNVQNKSVTKFYEIRTIELRNYF